MNLDLDKSTWQRVKLGDYVAASRERVDPNGGTVKRYVAGEHMGTDDLKIHQWGDPAEVDLGPAFHRRFRPGQVLYGSRRTYLRKVAVADFDGVCANTTFVLETMEESKLRQDFLPFIMTSERFHAFAVQESKGSVNPYVNWSDIARFEFDLPPLDEQNRIANLFWAIETRRRAAQMEGQALRSARDVWVSRQIASMIGLKSVSFAELWSRSPESGWSAAPVDEFTGCYVLSLAALGPDGYRMGKLKNVLDSVQSRSATLRQGDFLVSRANTAALVGRAGIFSEDRDDVSFPDTMMRLSLQDGVEPEFAVAVLMSAHGRAHMKRSAAGSATSMVKINRESLGRLVFPMVGADAQRAFLGGASSFAITIRQISDEMDAVDRLRETLLDKVFGARLG